MEISFLGAHEFTKVFFYKMSVCMSEYSAGKKTIRSISTKLAINISAVRCSIDAREGALKYLHEKGFWNILKINPLFVQNLLKICFSFYSYLQHCLNRISKWLKTLQFGGFIRNICFRVPWARKGVITKCMPIGMSWLCVCKEKTNQAISTKLI